MSVAEYAAKFESLCAFSPHYNTPEAENDKCVKFESDETPKLCEKELEDEIEFMTVDENARRLWTPTGTLNGVERRSTLIVTEKDRSKEIDHSKERDH
ncbi:hypothetical protein TSUD_378690 [Trifolium subterraneum]|uniref:Retrotransposon gag domain-containing protein n=1 Tax=Trifolium subterraneum TaxID=3900 RepID=A0A2Z6NA64_TRISU|nr:hypothetical protein TSUD_378690 [Trifolium subterraneum]